ncbi:MAG: ATP-binding cassette, subfamily bacterial [Actinomycetota bacterium]|jgi:ABC-type multidrug transport system fused ATPase/permease subunit|nr:ATP-binding cassette, subfamily bacterial [Actinomycetota bacterium]
MHPGPFTIAVTGAGVFAAATVASAVVLGKVTDKIIVPAFDGGVPRGTVLWGVAGVLGVALLRCAAIVIRRYFAGLTAARVQRSLRTSVIDSYRRLPLAYHRSQSAGELLAHAEADVEAATDILHPLPFSTAAILLIVFATGALIVTDPFLALIGLLVMPVMTVLNRLFGVRVEPPASKAQNAMGRVSAVAHESFDGALVVKTLGREAEEVQRLEAKAEELRRHRVEFGQLRAGFEPAFDGIPNLGIIVLLAMGSWRVSTGDVTIGVLVQFVSLFQLIAFPMRLIGWVLSDMPRAVVGRDRLEAVFQEKSTLADVVDGANLPSGPLRVRADGVSFAYGGHPVLSDISFDIEPNESVALVGSTGSGKSTLSELLVRLADPDSGTIELGGIDLRKVATHELRNNASVVFQESFLFATTILENISLERTVTRDEVERVAKLAQAHDFIERLPQGYETVVGERGVTLSGGQRQRVALARALLSNPRLLILDDATSSVDPTIEHAILEGLRNDLSTTLIVIAYRVSTISLADRVLFLENGRIAAEGHHIELLRYPAYDAMVRAYERASA